MRHLGTQVALFITGVVFSTLSSAQVNVRDGFFDSAGVKIHYIEAGQGEAVFLHHGLTSHAQALVDVGLFERLAPNFRVIAMDARGHGQSGKPHTLESYGVEMSNDIIRLLDHLGIEKTHIVGYSMGVFVIGKAVVSHEDRFLSATFGGGAPDWEWPQELDEQIRAEAQNMRENPPQRVVDLGLDNLALSLVIDGESQLVVTKEGLEGLRIPLMAIVGSEDDGMIDYVRNFAELLPNMNYVVMDGIEHNVGMRAPQFAASLAEFLAANKN